MTGHPCPPPSVLAPTWATGGQCASHDPKRPWTFAGEQAHYNCAGAGGEDAPLYCRQCTSAACRAEWEERRAPSAVEATPPPEAV